ncbi:hypothetical protein [Nocardia aurea]|uniref:hypothetical protein n=1 Tax=Nocardia aurea TaxID=2144174 RepID=UPI0033B9D062
MKFSATPDGLITQDDQGRFLLSCAALAVVFGVSEEQVKAKVGPSGNPGATVNASMPYLWLQNGRRRIREAFAAIGDEDMADALAYLQRLEGAQA